MSLSIHYEKTYIPNNFIDKYFEKSPHMYCTIYIYAFRLASFNEKMSNEIIANKLRIPLSDVINAWKYFESEGIIEYYENPFKIIFKEDFTLPRVNKFEQKKFGILERYNYSAKEIECLLENNKLKNLIKSAQHHLNKTLNSNDISTIIGLNEWLGLPIDVIEILFAYCTENNHYSLKYIEAVAIDWAEKNITTQKEAIDYINLHNKDFRLIMKSMGISNIEPTPSQKDFMTKWIFEYNMDLKIICMACEKTVNTICKANFKYTDAILESWFKKNVKIPEDIKKLDDDFNKSQSDKNQNLKPKNNRFINYEQRNWNFDEIEKMEKERIKKRVETANYNNKR